MEDALTGLLIPTLAAALLGLLKWGAPQLRERIPNVLWPFAILILAKVGAQACDAVGASCGGNPLNWDPATVQLFAVAAVAMIVREATKGLQRAAPKVVDFLQKR
jgi:hypothetical protein